MNYELTFEDRGEYLYIKVCGTNSPAAVAGYLADIARECERRERYRILIDERLEGPRLDIGEVFEIASTGSMNALGLFHAIAYVDSRMGDLAGFAETVAVNRGMPVRTFPSVEPAEAWLLSQVEGVNEQDIFRGDD